MNVLPGFVLFSADGVPMPSRSFYSDKDHEWHVKLSTVVEQIRGAHGVQRPQRLSQSGLARSAEGRVGTPTSSCIFCARSEHGAVPLTASSTPEAHPPGTSSSSFPEVLRVTLPASACSSSVSPVPTNTSGESRRVRVSGLPDEVLAASAARVRADEAKEAKRRNDLAAISSSLASETLHSALERRAASSSAPRTTNEIPTGSSLPLFPEVPSSPDKGTTGSVAGYAYPGGITRLQLMSVDDLVVLMRGLELLRCCSTALASEALALLSRRQEEVTPGHLPALLCGFSCIASHEVEGNGSDASAPGAREVARAEQPTPAAAAVQLFDGLLSKVSAQSILVTRSGLASLAQATTVLSASLEKVAEAATVVCP